MSSRIANWFISACQRAAHERRQLVSRRRRVIPRLEALEARDCPALVATPGSNVNISQMVNTQAETTSAIDPKIPDDAFVASVNFRTGVSAAGLFAAYRRNIAGTLQWYSRVMATGAPARQGGDSLPTANADPSAAFDVFGNLFLAYTVPADGIQQGQSTEANNGDDSLVEAGRTWTPEEWTGFQLRITTGTGAGTTVYSILSNNSNTLFINGTWANGTPDASSQYVISAPSTSVALVTSLDAGQTFQFRYWLENSQPNGPHDPPPIDQPTVATGPGVVLQAAQAVTGATNDPTTNTGTLTDNTANWAVNQWANDLVTIVAGTGVGQTRTILSNTATTLTVGGGGGDWGILPDATSEYLINTTPGSVWVAWQSWILGNPGHTKIVAAGAPVTGFGAWGAFGATQTVPGSTDTRFPDIKIGPTGQVAVAFQSNLKADGLADIRTSLKADGLGPGPFTDASLPAGLAARTGVGYRYRLDAQPDRLIDASVSLAWDRSGKVQPGNNGLLYLVYTFHDIRNTNPDFTDIRLRTSTDGGLSWNDPRTINDPSTHSKFLPTVAVDQVTGWVAAVWYDSRNNIPGIMGADRTGQIYGAVSAGGTSAATAPFGPDVQIGAQPSYAPGDPNLFDFGDYIGMDFYNKTFLPAWADNSNSTGPPPGDNPNGQYSNMDVYTAAVQVSVAPGGNAPRRLAVAGVASPTTSATGVAPDVAVPEVSPHRVLVPPVDLPADLAAALLAGRSEQQSLPDPLRARADWRGAPLFPPSQDGVWTAEALNGAAVLEKWRWLALRETSESDNPLGTAGVFDVNWADENPFGRQRS
jgi:hypothetical protein